MTFGGELELPLAALCGSGEPSLLGWARRLAGETAIVSTGRAALRLVLGALRKADPALRSLLVPSYLCSSLLPPFESEGLAVQLFPVGADLRLPFDSLRRRLHESGAGGVVFINYFGFPLRPEEREALAEIKREAWLIEDCAPGGLVESRGREIGGLGHFAFTSFRKYTPLPDGALVWNGSGRELPAPAPEETPHWVRAKLLGKLLRAEFLRGDARARHLEDAFLELLQLGESALDSNGGCAGASRLSLGISGIDIELAAARRRANFERLLALVREDPPGWARPLLVRETAGSSPTLFPLVCRDRELRDALKAHLARHRVFCPIHWPAPEPVRGGDFRESLELAETMLGLPIDQRYEPDQMAELHRRLLQFSPAS